MRFQFALPVALFTSAMLAQFKSGFRPSRANDSPGDRRSAQAPSRITAAKVAWVLERLGPRDHAIVQTLGRVRVATAQQLERLHFFSSSPLSNARSARATLARLARWRVLARLDRRVGGVRAGSASYVYALDGIGQRILQAGRSTNGSRLRRPWTPSAPFLDHALTVTELYTRLVEGERASQYEVITFDAEPACWRSFNGPAGEIVLVKPDAHVVLGVNEFAEHAFVEVDLGTESATALKVKFDRYRAYWLSGREQRANDVFPRVLWLVPNEQRRRRVVEVAGHQPPEAWQLFKVALIEDAVSALAGGGDG